ncbi:hypothetical protein Tco_0186132 [Tanacetum coccineum]
MVQEVGGSHGLLESSRSDEGLELIQEEDTQPSENTSKVHNEVAPIEEYELGDLNEPPNYKAALSDPKSEKWLQAVNTEMQSMKDNQVWVLVELPPNGRTVGTSGSNVAFLILYVDDILLMGNNVIMLQEVKSWLYLSALSQSAYQEKTLKKFRMENSKKGYTPMIEKPDYRKFIMYAVRCTRPDVAFAQNLCSRFQQNPGEIHWTAVKTILKYLKNNEDMVLVYGAKPEAELRMRKFIDGPRDVVPSNKIPMEMLCDNEPAVAIANDPRILKGARHFQRKYHYIREVIQEREIILKKVHTYDNVADPFTKLMPFNKHYEHAMAIGIVPASILM